MPVTHGLEQARRAFDARAWGEAHAGLAAEDEAGSLPPDDLEKLARTAYLTGREAASVDVWERAHHAFLDTGDAPGAARCAFWIAFVLLHRGEMARGGGWLARAGRVLDDAGKDCVERGFLLFPVALQHIGAADFATAHRIFTDCADIGERFGDVDLITLARHGQGRALIRLGDTAAGTALLDEAMVAITADEVSPILAGDIYCSVIEGCQEIFDVRRAQEWTQALNAWCLTQSDLVPYRGQCLVHRSELLQLHGEWTDALEESERARQRLSDPPGQPALGMAYYQQAELHRVRGAFTKAEQAYEQASQYGRGPQPGLALLWLARGEVEAAHAAIRHVLEETEDRVGRSKLLSGYVEVVLAAGDVAAARAAADELAKIAAGVAAPWLTAMSGYLDGAVLLSEGRTSAAVTALRRALKVWCELDVPYEAARTRVLLGRACHGSGDAASARFELDHACRTFRELGAGPDLANASELVRRRTAVASGQLTTREIEVLQFVATGATNRRIAEDLVISEKTVARHLSNVFTKLGISSRSAATAYAYEHDLV
jgi:DNA-binding CsgD family transcriptional regulator